MPLFGEKRRRYDAERRAAWKIRIHAYLGGRCAVCGTQIGLEIHHRDPSKKKFYISRIWSHRWEKQQRELAKCELRCTRHHKEFHASPHGSKRRYDNGCRCRKCVTVYRAQNRVRMAI